MKQFSFRPLLTVTHRWAGITVAILILFQGVTGILLTFGPEIDRALNADLMVIDERPATIDPFTAAENAQRAFPGWEIQHIKLNVTPGLSHEVTLRPSEDAEGDHRKVYIDLADGRVVGSRNADGALDRRGIVRFMALLHYDLLLGDIGRWVLGIVAILWLALTLAGIWLTMPLRKRNFWRVWRLSWKWPRLSADRRYFYAAHRATGLWTAPLLIGAAVTAFFLTLGDDIGQPMVKLFSPVSEFVPAPVPGPMLPGGDIGWRNALERARAAVDGPAQPREIFDAPENAAYRVFFLTPQDFHTQGRTIVDVNKLSGTTAYTLQATGTAGDVFLGWQIPLHTGLAFGDFYRFVVAFGGLATAFLVVAGLVSWAKTRRRKVADDKATPARKAGRSQLTSDA